MIFRLVTNESISLVLLTAEFKEQKPAMAELKTWADQNGYTIAQTPDDNNATAIVEAVYLVQ